MSTSGRCHWCGYQLKGLPILGECPECGTYGKCPECGKAYTAKSAARLQPWPSAYVICLRLGWPIVGLVISGILTVSTDSYDLQGWVMGFGYFMAVAIAINSYFQVRSMLRRSLPEQIRTKGPVAIWRKIGTTICVIILLVFIGGPLGISVACLIMLSNY
ncbi:MAG: hypothetical protein IH984_09960 [Planctomycetes bacterium]|nr:hypothetical protein [Planctomycetota bacterium]